MVIPPDLKGLSRSAIEQACVHLLRRVNDAETTLQEHQLQAQAKDAKIADLQAQLAYLQKMVFGRKSERTTAPDPAAGTQTNFLDAPVTHEAEPEASAERAAEPAEIETVTYQRKKPTGRKAISRELPVKEIILLASDAERVGPDGQALVSLGYETTELLDLVPERLQRLIIKREKLGLPDTREYVSTVPMPARLVPGSKATDVFLLHVTLQKFGMGLPLYRQTQAYNRLGAGLADNFLGECVRHIAAAFRPVALAIRAQVLQAPWVFADETPIRQLKAGKGPADGPDVRTSQLWAWVGDKQVSFHYGLTRSAKEVRDVLGIPYDPDDPLHGWNNDLDPTTWQHGEFIGFLLCDGFAGYNPVFRSQDIIRVACWVHARRKFLAYEAHDKNAQHMVGLFNQIFRAEKTIQRQADKQSLDKGSAQCHQFVVEQRQNTIVPLIHNLHAHLQKLKPCYSPDSGMGGAITYCENRWDALQVFLNHGFLPLENNTAERAIRPIAVGRKNWLFVGSEDAGDWAATLFILIESCRLQNIDYTAYCRDILARIVNAPNRDQIDYHQLTPKAWKQAQRQPT